VYLCGYGVELALKARICQTLGWPGYPETRREFEDLRSLQTHNFDVLIRLSGIEARVKVGHLAAWATVTGWSPDIRYRAIGTATAADAAAMITATRELLGVLV
jgi:hypothetical protein